MSWRRPSPEMSVHVRGTLDKLRGLQGSLRAEAASCREQAEQIRAMAEKLKQEGGGGRVDQT